MARSFAVTHAARESPLDGQYYRLGPAGDAIFSLDARCMSLEVNGMALLHMPLAACSFAASSDRLLIVPASRAPAWMLQLQQAVAVADALCSAGCVVEVTSSAMASPFTDADLESAYNTPGFTELVAQIEDTLTRRQTLGLPMAASH